MFAKGNVLLTVCSFCPLHRSAAATASLHSEMSLFESELQVTFSEMELKASHRRRKKPKPKADCKPALVHPQSPSVTPYLSLQSPIMLLNNQRGNEKVGLAISYSVRSKAYHAVSLLTLRLTTQALSKS